MLVAAKERSVVEQIPAPDLIAMLGSKSFGAARSQARDQEKTGAIPTSHRMSPASLVAEATTSRAIPRSKHGLDLAEETGSAVVTWTKTKYRYPLSPRFFPVSRKRTALTAILTLEADCLRSLIRWYSQSLTSS